MPGVMTTSASQLARKNKAHETGYKDATITVPHEEERAHGRAVSLLFTILLALSGAAALVYQVLWIKQLSLVVGAEVYSVTIAVSAFFTGLAFGSSVFGRWADKLAKPLLLYALLEAGVALSGFAATVLLAHAALPFAAIEQRVGVLAWILPFILVGTPAFLMGGTLPVAIRGWAPARNRVARSGGNVYAANTAGGIAGALLSTFTMLPLLGIRNTAYVAAALNLIACAGALLLSRTMQTTHAKIEATERKSISKQARMAMILYALAGGIALGYEVAWSQAIVQFISTRSFAFSIVLATYLTGLVLGSFLYARFSHRIIDPWGVFGFLIAAAGLIALLEIAGLSAWQLRVQSEFGILVFYLTHSAAALMYARFLVAALGIVFLPTLLLGAAFPAALQLSAREGWIGRDIGLVLALNTAGGVIGTIATGFLLLPLLGLVHTLAILAIGAATLGVLAVLNGTASRGKIQWAVLAVGAATLAAAFLTPPDRLGRLLAVTRGGTLVSYEESNGGTVAVVEQHSGSNRFRRLYVQGVSNSGDAMPSLRYMRLQALLPLIIHNGEPRSALVIGFGTGITAGALLQYPQLQQTVCAELLPAVVRAAAAFPTNFDAAKDPRLSIRLIDGRRELMRNSSRYDLITLEPPPPSARGVANLYSAEFYALAAARLDKNGLLAQWLPLATQTDADTRSLVRTFLDSFPYATLWTTELHETLMIGSFEPILLDARRIEQRFDQTQVSGALGDVGIASPAALLATWVTGRDGLERFASGAQPVTDDRPRIEYSAWVQPDELTRTLPELLALRSDPPIASADERLLAGIAQERANLTDFYNAGIAGYKGDRQAWKQYIAPLLQRDHENPYYGWFVGQPED